MTTDTNDSMLETVQQIIEQIMGDRLDPTSALSPETSLIYDLGFESIDFVLLLDQLQEHFADLPLAEHLDTMTAPTELRVRDLLAWIGARGAQVPAL